MKLLPRSLFGRLLGISALTTIAALLFAAFSIGHVLERFVIHGLDQQLDAQIGILAKAVRPDGSFDQRRVTNLPAFDEPDGGWSWRVDGPSGEHWSSGPAIDVSDRTPFAPRGPDAVKPGPRPGDAHARSGEPVHFRQLSVETAGGPVVVTAAGPRRIALRPLREAMVPLVGSLALLGIGLALATLLQLRIGLRPLRSLQGSVADVRAGRARHVQVNQPAELAPLAAELNALIDQNEAGLEHARRHVSNLAHGLKTPLAALSIKLAENGRDPDGSLSEIVARIDSRIRHHLGRARAAAISVGTRSRTLLAPALADLRHAMERIHADRTIEVELDIATDLVVGLDPQDLDEMAGNLLDNACRHARSIVQMAARQVDLMVVVTIDDDGPGLTGAAIEEVLLPGRRLDEHGDGHGFGLSIAAELAELNGGALTLLASPTLSGLRASLTLPVSH